MATAVYQYYKELPPWAKGVVIVGGLAVTIFTTKAIVDALKKAKDDSKRLIAVKEGREELEALAKQGIKPSYADSQFTAWADSIATQFDGCDLNWRVVMPLVPTAIIEGLSSNSAKLMMAICDKLKNDADFLKLVTAFNKRTYDQCGLMTGDFTGNLYECVQDELNRYEVGRLNKLLAEKKISYTF